MTETTNIVGLTVDEAKKIIVYDHDVYFISENSFVTADYRPERTRIYYNPETNLITGVRKG